MSSSSPATIPLLCDCKLNTLALWQTDPWLLLANDENVSFPGRKGVVNGILDMHNVEASVVALAMRNHTNTAHVTTTGRHSNNASIELNGVGDLSGREINLNGIVHLDKRVGIPNTVSLEPFNAKVHTFVRHV